MTGPQPGDPGMALYPDAARRHRPERPRGSDKYRTGYRDGVKRARTNKPSLPPEAYQGAGGGGGGNRGCRFLTLLMLGGPALLLLIPLLVLVPALWIPAAVATVLGLATRTNKETP